MSVRVFGIVLLLVIAANAALVLQAFSPEQPAGLAVPLPVDSLRTGDIVCRMGRGMVSNLLRKAGHREQRFSHAGIILKEKNNIHVLHMAAEPRNGLNQTDFREFVAPDVAQSAAVYRPRINEAQRMKLEQLMQVESQGNRPFDHAFERSNGSAQYCTEWIASLMSQAGCAVLLPESSVYITPDDIYLQEGTRLVYTFGTP